jgi:uncharacterized RDD family membrane protein YckC
MENLDSNITNDFSVNPGASLEMASAGDRFIAALIDGVLCAAVSVIPILGWIVGLAYQFTKDALPFLDGQSLGKKVMKIRVVEEATGTPITNKYDKAILRAVSLIIPLFGIIDAAMVLSAEKKRFGDKWAGTIVIKENK